MKTKNIKLFDVGVMIGIVLLVMGMVAAQKDTDKHGAGAPGSTQPVAISRAA